MQFSRALSVAVSVISLLASFAFGQQWDGPDNTTDPIHREGAVELGSSLTLKGPFPWIDVRAFGAIPNDGTDDSDAIQDAINSLSYPPPAGYGYSNCGTVLFPPGVYRLENSIEIVSDNAHDYLTHIELRGSNAGAGGMPGCILEWHGAIADDPMLKLWSEHCIVRNICFRAKTRTIAAIDVDNSPSPPSQRLTASNDVFEFLHIEAETIVQIETTYSATAPVDTTIDTTYVQSIAHGIRIAKDGTGGNCEEMRFRNCSFQHLDSACVYIACPNGQSKDNTFFNCLFYDAKYGIKTKRGSFQTYSCGFGTIGWPDPNDPADITGSAIYLNAPTDNIIIQDSDTEDCYRFLETSTLHVGSWPVSIIGGRFSWTRMASDGEYIKFGYGGPLVILNATFDSIWELAGCDPKDFKIAVDCPDFTESTSLVSIGNFFPNEEPYKATEPARLISLGNQTGEQVAGDSIFTIDTSFEVELADSIISKGLQKRFGAEGYPLTDEARVEVARVGEKWRIYDVQNNFYLIWKKSPSEMNVYYKWHDLFFSVDDEIRNLNGAVGGIRLPETLIQEADAGLSIIPGTNSVSLTYKDSSSSFDNIRMYNGNTFFDGNVGIGTTNPAEMLEVAGNIRASQVQVTSNLLGWQYGGEISFPSGDIVVQSRPGRDIIFRHGGVNESSRITPNGNVGIGITAPARNLHVNNVFRLEPRATEPSDASMGDMYIRSSDGKLMVYDGTDWRACW